MRVGPNLSQHRGARPLNSRRRYLQASAICCDATKLRPRADNQLDLSENPTELTNGASVDAAREIVQFVRSQSRGEPRRAGPATYVWILLPLCLLATLFPHNYLMIAICIGVALVAALFAGVRPVGNAPIWAVLFFVLGVSSVAWSIDPASTAANTAFELALLGAFLSAYFLTQDARAPTAPLLCLAIAGVATATVYIVLSRVDPGVAFNLDPTAISLTRPTLSWVDTNYTAYAINLGIAAVAALTLTPFGRRGRFLWVVVAGSLALCGIALLETGTRSALSSVILIGLAYPLARWKSRLAIRAGLAAYLALTLLSCFGLLETVVKAIGIDQLRDDATGGTLGGRDTLWRNSLDAARQNPLLGVGQSAYGGTITQGISTHNVALSVLLSLGIIGLVVFSIFFIKSFHPPMDDSHFSTVTRGTVALILWASLPPLFGGAWVDTFANWVAMGIAGGLAAQAAVRRRAADRNCGAERRVRGLQPVVSSECDP